MSAEIVVKKRGRPKKIVSDPEEVKAPASNAPKKTTARAKSTKTDPKPTKNSKASPAAKPVQKVTSISPPESKITAKSAAQESKVTQQLHSSNGEAIPKTSPTTPVTPETSKILNQVRELSTKNATPQANPTLSPSKPSISKSTSHSPPPKVPTPPTAPVPPSNPSPKVQISSLNSQIVDNITSRAGARPNASTKQNPLPPNYKSAARKVTMAIVAMPIVVVTSYVLYQRCEYILPYSLNEARD